MSTVNSVNVGLSGSTGTGTFVGATSPTISLPLINNTIHGYSTTATAAGNTTLVVGSNYQQFFTGVTTQSVIMPVTSTLTIGQAWLIVNNSTGIVTVKSSGSNNILAIPAGTDAIITCIAQSGTTAADWNAEGVSGVAGVDSITGTANQITASAPTGAVTLSLPSNIANAISTVAVQAFTGNGTYTPTSGMKYCIVQAVSGGGGGGGAASTAAQAAQGGGGGAGAYGVVRLTAAQVGASQTVTIGAAGTGGTAGNNNGVDGGTTSLGTLLVISGGIKGIGAPASAVPSSVAGGVGGTVTTGDVLARGAPGGLGVVVSGTSGFSGIGGSGIFGGGGNMVAVGAGNAGVGYGAGGAGAGVINGSAAAAGGNGSAGVMYVTEYI